MEEFYKAGKIRAIGVSNFGPDRYLDLQHFAEGRKEMFTDPVLTAIGAKYGKTAAQTALRFLMQSDVVIIPKSVHKERMHQNFDLFDFTLSAGDMAAIEALDGGESLFFSHYDPKTVEWFMSLL